MIEEHILDFLETGELNNFPFGTPHKTIVNALGPNYDWRVPLNNSDDRDELVKYGLTELYFTTDHIQKLSGVLITYADPADEKNFSLELDILDESMPYNDVKEFLAENDIPFEEVNDVFSDKVIITESQVEFYFDEEGMLKRFGRFV